MADSTQPTPMDPERLASVRQWVRDSSLEDPLPFDLADELLDDRDYRAEQADIHHRATGLTEHLRLDAERRAEQLTEQAARLAVQLAEAKRMIRKLFPLSPAELDRLRHIMGADQ